MSEQASAGGMMSHADHESIDYPNTDKVQFYIFTNPEHPDYNQRSNSLTHKKDCDLEITDKDSDVVVLEELIDDYNYCQAPHDRKRQKKEEILEILEEPGNVEVKTSLPPEVKGQLQYFCRVSVKEVTWDKTSQPKVTNVYMKWPDRQTDGGAPQQKETDGLLFSPKDKKGNSAPVKTYARFPVMTDLEKFSKYLQECKLVLDVLDTKHLGKVEVTNIGQLDLKKKIDSKYPIKDTAGKKIGELHVTMEIEPIMGVYVFVFLTFKVDKGNDSEKFYAAHKNEVTLNDAWDKIKRNPRFTGRPKIILLQADDISLLKTPETPKGDGFVVEKVKLPLECDRLTMVSNIPQPGKFRRAVGPSGKGDATKATPSLLIQAFADVMQENHKLLKQEDNSKLDFLSEMSVYMNSKIQQGINELKGLKKGDGNCVIDEKNQEKMVRHPVVSTFRKELYFKKNMDKEKEDKEEE